MKTPSEEDDDIDDYQGHSAIDLLVLVVCLCGCVIAVAGTIALVKWIAS